MEPIFVMMGRTAFGSCLHWVSLVELCYWFMKFVHHAATNQSDYLVSSVQHNGDRKRVGVGYEYNYILDSHGATSIQHGC